jgi:hypothetical protein
MSDTVEYCFLYAVLNCVWLVLCCRLSTYPHIPSRLWWFGHHNFTLFVRVSSPFKCNAWEQLPCLVCNLYATILIFTAPWFQCPLLLGSRWLMKTSSWLGVAKTLNTISHPDIRVKHWTHHSIVTLLNPCGVTTVSHKYSLISCKTYSCGSSCSFCRTLSC